jgi:serine/threonine protein kinase
MSNPNPTFQIKDYVVSKKRIGKGAFSNIYKGYDKKNKKMVAIKEICLDTLSKYKDSIKRETKIMKNLDHPNIVTLYDTIIDDATDNIYLVLEYFERGDFSKFLKKRPLKEKFAKKYLKQLADGLKYLLENKIIHRDLKPQNILVSSLGDIKITDFGFARYFDNDMVIQTICGSPMYMAPEIMKKKKYDFKSDLWSVGVIFYEMLVGRTPFKAKNIFDLMRQIEKNSIKLPEDIHISVDCKDLLFKLLKKDPEDRITWEEFFNHPWLKSDFKEREDMLMEISNLNSFTEMNNLIENNSNSFFENHDSFSQKDVKIVTSNRESVLHNVNNELDLDLSLKFNFELEESDGNSSDSEDDNDVFYDSYETKQQMEDNMAESVDNSFIKINFNDNYFNKSFQIKKDIRKDRNLKDFEYISSSLSSGPQSPMLESSSLIEYLNNSIFFFKQSYKYISNFNSL